MKRIVMIIMAVALVALPTMAQNFGDQEQPKAQFQSTSTMKTSGSVYASQPVINVDGTAYNPSTAATPSGSRRAKKEDDGFGGNPADPGTTTEPGSPIGDAVLPLMLMALAFCGIVYYRRRKALNC